MKLKPFRWLLETPFANRFSAPLVALNLVLFALAFRELDPSNLSLHFEYQPICVKIFLLLNFPAVAIAGLILIPLAATICGVVGTTFEVFAILIASVFQWGIVGILLEKLFLPHRHRG